MPKLHLTPGINSQATQTLNSTGWFACNLIRWRNGLLEKLAGWQRLFATPCAGIVRVLHAYTDLSAIKYLLIGGDGGAQVYNGTGLYDFLLARITTYYVVSNVVQVQMTADGLGLTSVTVAQTGSNAQAGSRVQLSVSFTAGGLRLPAGTILTVTANVDPDSWKFNLPSPATSTAAGNNQIPGLYGGGTLDSSADNQVHVFWTDHGYSAGDTFTLDQPTTIPNSWDGGGVITSLVTVQPGTFSVVSVYNTDQFLISLTVLGGGTPTAWGITYVGSYRTLTTSSTIIYPALTYIQSPPSNSPAWFADNLGQTGLFNFTNSQLWAFTPPVPISGNPAGASIPTAPQINAGFFTAMPQAQVVTFGTDTTLGSGVADPLLARWSDAGGYTNFTASTTNQAGSFRLGGSGTRIVAGSQLPQTLALWTDNDLWSMVYAGPPFVYSFTVIATGCGIVSSKAFATIGRTTYWMSVKGFFRYSDGGVEPVECPVWDIVFGENGLDIDDQLNVFAVAFNSTHEIWFFFPIEVDTDTGPTLDNEECTNYVKVNVINGLWDYGTLSRTAGIGENAFGLPLMADPNFRIQQHEVGYDDDGSPMTGVFAETGYADIADGSLISFVDKFTPDMKWFGNDGSVGITIKSTHYPGQTPNTTGPFQLTRQNWFTSLRVRARQIAIRFDWSPTLGFSARLGAPRIRVKPSGRR